MPKAKKADEVSVDKVTKEKKPVKIGNADDAFQQQDRIF